MAQHPVFFSEVKVATSPVVLAAPLRARFDELIDGIAIRGPHLSFYVYSITDWTHPMTEYMSIIVPLLGDGTQS